jgi:para-aminobenzoate synthetase / 4-amino-4-deoxychorismate lyase
MTDHLPRGAGTAIFAGGGAWLAPPFKGDEAVVLSQPSVILVAERLDQIAGLLAEVEAAQKRGDYVAGYVTYEAGAAFGFTVRPPAGDAVPLAWAAVYPAGSATVVAAEDWQRLLDHVDVSAVQQSLKGVTPSLSVTREQYSDAIGKVRSYIAAGDTYQINYTVRGRYRLAPAPGGAAIDPLDYFLALVLRQAVPYAAYLDLGEAQVLSLSPEMFVRRRGDLLESRPMKGTRPRGTTHAEDVALAYELADTEKERAENLMIVDMVRNDLGRVCVTGSVRVPALFTVEPYRTVWQMTSTVTGTVRPQCSLVEIMAAVFPGASITGAPKYHTMELIARLESEPRGVYTGTVALFCPGGDFTGNIAIRTIIHRDGACMLGTGSGIVWDAEAGAEYEETLAKAAFATPPKSDTWRPAPRAHLDPAVHGIEDSRLFETLLLAPRDWDATIESTAGMVALSSSLGMSDNAVLDRYAYLEDHLDRMEASAAALGFAFDRVRVRLLLIGEGRLNPGALVIRVDLDPDGRISVSTREAPVTGCERRPAALMVSPFRTDQADPLLQHKTAVRGFYNREHRRATHQGFFDALFLNRLDRVTEGAITNLFARFGDRWVPPPVTDGLLPGIWRAHYMAETEAEERSLTLDELAGADEIVAGNSVRGGVSIDMIVADPVVF